MDSILGELDVRNEMVSAAFNKAMEYMHPYNNIDLQHLFRKQIVFADKTLTKDEASRTIYRLTQDHERRKLLYNRGEKRLCETCHNECLAISYCEYCIRNYLKANFSNWTSGNDNIDNLIQQCQMKSIRPNSVTEWIPYNHLADIKYLTKGGCSKIYEATWVPGQYREWDSEKQQLKRVPAIRVILKTVDNIENADRSWFDEAQSHMTIANKWGQIVRCFGLTQNPSFDKCYMLVLNRMEIDLERYLQQNRNQLGWEEKFKIVDDIILALSNIHTEGAVHRDLHSGNVLLSPRTYDWYISDLGFCGPTYKPLKRTYGKLPYIAPEALVEGDKYTFASDIYSVGILMWEISSNQPPFNDYKYELAIDIINGMRPEIVPGTPLEYIKLMERCWDADPAKRPDIDTLSDDFYEMENAKSYNQNPNEEQIINSNTNLTNNSSNFDFLFSNNNIEPKNATERTSLEYKKLMEQYWNTDEKQQTSNNTDASSGDFNFLMGGFRNELHYFKDLSESKNATKEYKELMEQYWNTDENQQTSNNTDASSGNFNFLMGSIKSELHHFKDLPKPKNATKEEQKAFHRH